MLRVCLSVIGRPGASPQLFGDFLMPMAAFLSLEDIAQALPPYREEVVPVEMDEPLRKAYEKLEEDIREALKEHRGNNSVVSVGMNALLLYPDRPFGLGTLYGWEYDPDAGRRERFVIAEPVDLPENVLYAKERKLLEEIKASLNRGRKVHVFAVYTRTRDVTRRLERILQRKGVRVAVLSSDVKPEVREAWYERQSRQGVQVVISHPKLVSLGLDLLEYKDLIFGETGYSLYTLRQASRRSWRIGQTEEVTVKYFAYARTAQETCLRLMGRKLLVAMGMEGKFSAEGLQAQGEDDFLMAMARELVTEKGIGENAQAVWRAVQQQNTALLHTSPIVAERRSEPPSPPFEAPLPLQEPLAGIGQLLLFGSSPAAAPGHRRTARQRPIMVSGGTAQLAGC